MPSRIKSFELVFILYFLWITKANTIKIKAQIIKENISHFPYIDAEDEYLKEKRENQHEAFNEVTQDDDLSLEEGNNMDGQSVTLKELPTQTIKYISDNYPDWNFTDGIIISEDNQLKYSVFIKREGYRDRKRLLFDMKGKFLKEEDL